MSKVKYPDKEKIRIQIDEILDKSELFDATEDKSSTYTNDKIVQLKPVKQHLPVGKYIGAVAAIAAIVVFVIAVKNYQTVGRGEQSKISFVPLATSSSEADMHESTAEEATVKQSQISDMIIEDYNSYEMLYSKLNVMSEGTINIENRTEYGYTYSVRNDNVATRNNVVLYIDVPYDIKYNDKQLIGGAAIDATGVPLPEATIASAKTADAVLLGAVGGPKWDNVAPEIRPEKGLLGIRKALGLYCNLRPIKVSRFVAHLSPLKNERVSGTDLLIVRELTGGIYFGAKNEAAPDADGVETASDVEIYTRPEVERIARFAFEAAKKRRGKVTSVDKANVLASSRMWRRIVGEMQAQDYSGIELNNFYVDNCAMQLVLNPGQFDVVLTNNIFGDILSDEASVIAGSIGMLPSASLGDSTGMYEPIHGSAPDIAGQGIANPLGTIYSVAMMLRYSLDQDAAADAIEAAIDRVLEKGYRTPDLCGEGLTKVSTSQMGQLIAAELA